MNDPGSPRPIIPFLGGLYAALGELAYPLVRVVAGGWLVPHGYEKMFGGDLPMLIEGLAKMGLQPAGPLAYLVAGTEFFGGILIAIGLLTRPAAAAATILLAVAIVTVHLPNGFSSPEGYAYPLMWMLLCVAVLLRGGGRFSLDRAIGVEF